MNPNIDRGYSLMLHKPEVSHSSAGQQESIDLVNSLPVNDKQINYLYLFKYTLVPLSAVFEDPLRKEFELEGCWDMWRHKTMTSEEALVHLRHFAEESVNTVFNYLDPPGKLEKREYVRLTRLRDDVARSRLRYGFDAPQVEACWEKLKAAICHHFIT